MLDANGNDERDCVPDIHAADGADAPGALVLASPRSGIGQARPFKQCIYCEQVKPAAEFHRHAYTTRTGKRSERFNSSCKQCHGERTLQRKQEPKYRNQQREYRAKNREQIRERNRRYVKTVPKEVRLGYGIKSKYGITYKQYVEMAEAQGNVCRVCGSPPEKMGVKARLHIDHDHVTGKIRGLLCHHCNVALGLTRESEDVLVAMISYLREHRG